MYQIYNHNLFWLQMTHRKITGVNRWKTFETWTWGKEYRIQSPRLFSEINIFRKHGNGRVATIVSTHSLNRTGCMVSNVSKTSHSEHRKWKSNKLLFLNFIHLLKEYVSDSFTNYNYVGNTKVSVSIKKTYANKCILSKIFLTEILKSFSVF